MKTLIIGFFTKSNMPYIGLYEQILQEKKLPYDVICLDRFNDDGPKKEENVYTFYSVMGTDKKKKIIPYLYFRHFVLSILRKNRYDKIIVLTTVPAVLFKNYLLKKYPGKFIFDYRDYSFEKIGFYKKWVNQIASKSYATFLSSKGFYQFVNSINNVYIVHNISNSEFKIEHSRPFKKIINIGFVGLVRYFDINTKLIDAFSNDEHFSLSYHGIVYDDCDLETYCKGKKVNNVTMYGAYNNADKPKIYQSINLINSIYSLQSPEVSRAIPNRLYDAALYKIPLIVADGCYLAEVVRKYHLGVVVDTKDSGDIWKKKIEDYVASFDSHKFDQACNKFLQDVEEDQRIFRKKVSEFLDA